MSKTHRTSRKTTKKIATRSTSISSAWIPTAEVHSARSIAAGVIAKSLTFNQLMEVDERGDFWDLARSIERRKFQADGIQDDPESGAKDAELQAAFIVGMEIGRMVGGR